MKNSKTSFITYLIIVSLALIGAGCCIYSFGEFPVDITQAITNYSALAVLILVIGWMIKKIDSMNKIPWGTILLNSGTLAWTFVMYVLYKRLDLDPVMHSLSCSGFNVVTALVPAIVYNNLSLMMRLRSQIIELESK